MEAEVLAAILVSVLLVVLVLLWLLIFFSGFGPTKLHSWQSRTIRLCKKRKRWSWTKIEEGLFLGSVPRSQDHLIELQGEKVGAIVTLNEAWELPVSCASMEEFGMKHLHLPTPDFFAPCLDDITKAVDFITECRQQGIGVYVHCNGGRGRSAVCVLCYLIKTGWPAMKAFQHVKSKRNIANMLFLGGRFHKQWRAVLSWQRRELGGPTRAQGRKVAPADAVKEPA